MPASSSSTHGHAPRPAADRDRHRRDDERVPQGQQAGRGQAERGADRGGTGVRATTSAKTGKFAHEADGREPSERAEAQGYRYCLVAENLALNLDSRGFETRQLAGDAVEGLEGVARSPRQPAAGGTSPISALPWCARPIAIRSSSPCSCSAGRKRCKVSSPSRTGREPWCATSWARRRHDLPPRTIATLYPLRPRELVFEECWRRQSRFAPRDGDRFVVRPGTGGASRSTWCGSSRRALWPARGRPRPMQKATAGCQTTYSSRASNDLLSSR